MKTNEMIAGLRKLCGQGSEYRRTVCRLAADTLETQQKRIEELEQLRAERRWIPVTEGLPEVGELVLACAGGEVDATWRESEENWAADPDCSITHWMPLPQPPKEGA